MQNTNQQPQVYLLNAAIIPNYGLWRFSKINTQKAQEHVKNGFISGIGHQVTAAYLSKLLIIDCPFNRQKINMTPGDSAIIFRFLERLPEGKLLTMDEICKLPYEFGLLERLE